MEDKIIVVVCGKPELYDSTNYFYRDKYRKDLAWRRVSEETGVAEDVCRKKWKGLRDTYLKERRKEVEKRRSRAAAGAAKKWSNMGKVEEMAEDLPAPPPEEDTSETEDTNGDDTEERSTPSEAPAASSVSDSAPSSSGAAEPPVGVYMSKYTGIDLHINTIAQCGI
ncbi:hypothetical protein CRENBAI_011842 [Crenichthys baileyi]|uniref:MADF domain-containing protein n=1 Tax=Crenichthys baileyi TaxID=28760 RepID=A0AAV9RJY5_9TELE